MVGCMRVVQNVTREWNVRNFHTPVKVVEMKVQQLWSGYLFKPCVSYVRYVMYMFPIDVSLNDLR